MMSSSRDRLTTVPSGFSTWPYHIVFSHQTAFAHSGYGVWSTSRKSTTEMRSIPWSSMPSRWSGTL